MLLALGPNKNNSFEVTPMRSFARRLSLLFILAPLATSANAGLITGGTLLNQAGADQLETWLGTGDLDFTNVWSGGVGATSSSWHAAVDGIGPSVSLYEIAYQGMSYLLGGYSTQSWGGPGSYAIDPTAFIFNLTTSAIRRASEASYPEYAIYRHPAYFATYGGGHDLYGGNTSLGGELAAYAYPGYTYGALLGGNIVDGTAGLITRFTVSRLETYTFADALPVDLPVDVPEPAPLALLAAGLLALSIGRLAAARRAGRGQA